MNQEESSSSEVVSPGKKKKTCFKWKKIKHCKEECGGTRGRTAAVFIVYAVFWVACIVIPGIVVCPRAFNKIELEEGIAILKKTPLFIKQYMHETYLSMSLDNENPHMYRALHTLVHAVESAGGNSDAIKDAREKFRETLHGFSYSGKGETRFSKMKYVAFFDENGRMLYHERHDDIGHVGGNAPVNTTKEVMPTSFFKAKFVQQLLGMAGGGQVVNFPGGDTVAVTVCRVHDSGIVENGVPHFAGYAVWAYSFLDDAHVFADVLGECHSVTADLDNPGDEKSYQYFSRIKGQPLGGMLNTTSFFKADWPGEVIVEQLSKESFTVNTKIICPKGKNFLDEKTDRISVGYLGIRDPFESLGHPQGPGFTLFLPQRHYPEISGSLMAYTFSTAAVTIVFYAIFGITIRRRVTVQLLSLRDLIRKFEHFDNKLCAKARSIRHASATEANWKGSPYDIKKFGEIKQLEDLSHYRFSIIYENLDHLDEEHSDEMRHTRKNIRAVRIMSMLLDRPDNYLEYLVTRDGEGDVGKAATLEAIMEHPLAMEFFKTYCIQIGCGQNVFFILDVEFLHVFEDTVCQNDPAAKIILDEKCEQVRQFYMGDKSLLLASKKSIKRALKEEVCTLDTLDHIVKEVAKNLENDILPQFKESLLFQGMLMCVHESDYDGHRVLCEEPQPLYHYVRRDSALTF